MAVDAARKAFTDPRHLANWWGPRGTTTTVVVRLGEQVAFGDARVVVGVHQDFGARGAVVRDEAAAAWRAVGRLPADRRRAIVLRFVEEMSTAEIAGVLGRSEGAVRVLIHRALRTVARELRGNAR